jgi:hypothetical protein
MSSDGIPVGGSLELLVSGQRRVASAYLTSRCIFSVGRAGVRVNWGRSSYGFEQGSWAWSP